MSSGHEPAVRPHILLDGPYGRANLGDNAIAYCMVRFLVRNGIDVTISCLDPEYISKAFGVSAVPMLDFRRLEFGPLKTLGEYDAVIIGGGQQLKEYRVPNPFVGMFARVCHMARSAEKREIPFVAWSVGMDWPLSSVARFLARRYLASRNATLILRDGKSFERMARLLDGKDCKIIENRDVVFMLPALLDAISSAEYRKKYAGSAGKRLLVCPSVVDGVDGLPEALVNLCIDAARDGYEVLGWHSEIRPNYDVRVRDMAAWDSIPGFRWLPPDPIDTNEVAALIASASLVVTTRMHPAIIATSQGVAAYGIATNGKMRSVFDELAIPYANADEVGALSFADIADGNFEPSFALATEFGRDAEQGGMQVLEAIRSKTSLLGR